MFASLVKNNCLTGCSTLALVLCLVASNGGPLYGAAFPEDALKRTVGIPCYPGQHTDWTIVDHIRKVIPQKNQNSSQEWVDSINETYGLSWHHNPKDRMGSFKCMSFAASTVSDWWQVELGRAEPFGSYRNFVHGRPERGENPRALEAQYYYRHSLKEHKFRLLIKYPFNDPVTKERIPYCMKGYCKILTNPLPPRSYADPLLGAEFAVYQGKADYGMDGEFVKLFDHQVFDFGDPKVEMMKTMLYRHGVIMVGLQTEMPFGWSIHAVTVVGYGRVGKKTYFVYRENYGDPDGGDPPTTEPAYRMARARRFCEAYVFPHRLRYSFVRSIDEGGYLLEVRNAAGRLTDLTTLDVTVGLAAASLPVTHAGTGRYLFRPTLRGKRTKWTARIRFTRRHHYPVSGEPYEVKARFDGVLLEEDARRESFGSLHASGK